MSTLPPQPARGPGSDPYAWLRERENPAVQAHLAAENAYTAAMLQSTTGLQKILRDEIQGRVIETDTSVPIKRGEYWYYVRTVEGLDYPIYCRRQGSMAAAEEVLLDQNVVAAAAESPFCQLGVFAVSPCHRYVAYSLDRLGSEHYVIYIRDTQTGHVLAEEITGTAPDLEWVGDSSGFYYVTLGAADRPDTVRWHQLGTDVGADTAVYTESDEAFWVSLDKTKDEQYVLINVAALDTSEVWYAAAATGPASWQCVVPRREKHEYIVEHWRGSWYVVSNYCEQNFSLLRVAVGAAWATFEEVYPAAPMATLEGVETFADFLCLYTRHEGLVDVVVLPQGEYEARYTLDRPEPIGALGTVGNPNFESNQLIVHSSSLRTPGQVLAYDLVTKEVKTLKEAPLVGVDSTRYQVERCYATAADGTLIPITLVGEVTALQQGNAPCWLCGYGAYGVVEEVGFQNSLLSLLDRGVLYAFAHVRGGGELGRAWYDAGKLHHKQNTFSDFTVVAEYLIASGRVAPDKVVAYGASAGGLLMGAVANQRPELFRAILAEVPFVDVLHTIQDESLPLTTMEYREWGNPKMPDQYATIAAYDPYHNVRPQAYPTVVAWSALNDNRVGYWEATKWVAALRECTTSERPILLRVDMDNGHGGGSGRRTHWDEAAFRLAVVLWALGEENGVDTES